MNWKWFSAVVAHLQLLSAIVARSKDWKQFFSIWFSGKIMEALRNPGSLSFESNVAENWRTFESEFDIFVELPTVTRISVQEHTFCWTWQARMPLKKRKHSHMLLRWGMMMATSFRLPKVRKVSQSKFFMNCATRWLMWSLNNTSSTPGFRRHWNLFRILSQHWRS